MPAWQSPADDPSADRRGVAEAKAWYWQRISAMVLAVFVVIHLVVMMIAVKGGLSAVEILSRTRGSWGFGIFYGLFVIACAVHVPIGLANIAREWSPLSEAAVRGLGRLMGAVILVLGFVAVWGVI